MVPSNRTSYRKQPQYIIHSRYRHVTSIGTGTTSRLRDLHSNFVMPLRMLRPPLIFHLSLFVLLCAENGCLRSTCQILPLQLFYGLAFSVGNFTASGLIRKARDRNFKKERNDCRCYATTHVSPQAAKQTLHICSPENHRFVVCPIFKCCSISPRHMLEKKSSFNEAGVLAIFPTDHRSPSKSYPHCHHALVSSFASSTTMANDKNINNSRKPQA